MTSASRIRRLLAAMARRREDAFLCARMSNIRYLTGFTGSDAVLVVSPDGVFLVTDGRYTEQARAEVSGAEVVISDRKWREASQRIRRMRPGRVGFESRWLTVEQFRLVSRGCEPRWIASPDPVETLRMRKDQGELRAMESAAIIASEALLAALSRGLDGRTEAELAGDIEAGMKRLGAGEPSFRTIVASGPRSAMPHAEPLDLAVDAAGPVVLDFGARFRGYCSDETVTLMPGKPGRRLGRVFDAVRKAQAAGIAAVGPGVPCREVDRRVRESLDRSGYLKYFVHSTGHGVGLDVHERPTLSPRSGDRLAEGMVVTVEPGVYIPGVGGVRLEDTVRVGASSASRVTFLPKSLSPLL
jgi:Xaa-Pro aminopeptidase